MITSMKKQNLALGLMTALALMASSCSQDNEEMITGRGTAYVASVENGGATRSYNGGSGAFCWSNGDDISVYTSNGFQTLTFAKGAGTAKAEFEETTLIPQKVAVFPVNDKNKYADGVLTVNYPSGRKEGATVSDPMAAFFADGQTNFYFRHLGGVIEFDVLVPAGISKFVVTTDKPITGDFTVDATDVANPHVSTSATESTAANSVTFTMSKTTAAGMLTFLLPVPTGTYSSMTLAIYDANGKLVKSVENTDEQTINRCDWVKHEINMSGPYTATIEQTVNGVDALNTLIANTATSDLAKQDLTVDLQGETLASSAEKKICDLNVNSLTLKNGVVEATGLHITAAGGITLQNIKMVGSFPKKDNGNARISLNSPNNIVVDGVDFTEGTDGYNNLEINQTSYPTSKNVTIKNCKFGKGNTNNSILIFGMPEGGVANIENCDFTLSSTSEAIRISNKLNTNKFTVNIKDCNYYYPDGFSDKENEKPYIGFILFEDHVNTATNAMKQKQFSGLEINCDNVTYNHGPKITSLVLGTGEVATQFACMCYDNVGAITAPTHFPTFTFK